MKNKNFRYSNLYIPVLMLVLALSSCKYNDYADVVYPEQTVYMPAAYYDIYDISEVYETYHVPTEGESFRYYIDNKENKLKIPLSVYRSGITNDGKLSVNISLNTDIIIQLINAGSLSSTEVLPSANMQIPSSVDIADGSDISIFELSIDLDFVKNNTEKQYAIGVEITSQESEVNPDLKTTVILIKTNSINY